MSKSGNITKLPSGSYRLRYMVNGKSYSKTIKAANLTEAKKVLNELVNVVKSGDISANMTYEELTNLWWGEYMKTFASPSTLNNSVSSINKRILPYLGGYKLFEITPQVLTKLLAYYETIRGRNGNLITVGTIRKYFTLISSTLSYGVRIGAIDTNPMSKVKLPLDKQADKTLHTYTPEQVKILFKELEKESLDGQLIIKLAVYCGLRSSEVFGLKWCDIDNGIMSINRSRHRVKGGFKVGQTKSITSKRKITLNEDLLQLLEEIRKNNNNTEYIINTYKGNIARYLHRLQKRANLPLIRYHDLRHTSATLLLSNGIDIKTVSDFLGHSNIRTTSIYLHSLDDNFKNASNCLSNVLK